MYWNQLPGDFSCPCCRPMRNCPSFQLSNTIDIFTDRILGEQRLCNEFWMISLSGSISNVLKHQFESRIIQLHPWLEMVSKVFSNKVKVRRVEMSSNNSVSSSWFSQPHSRGKSGWIHCLDGDFACTISVTWRQSNKSASDGTGWSCQDYRSLSDSVVAIPYRVPVEKCEEPNWNYIWFHNLQTGAKKM